MGRHWRNFALPKLLTRDVGTLGGGQGGKRRSTQVRLTQNAPSKLYNIRNPTFYSLNYFALSGKFLNRSPFENFRRIPKAHRRRGSGPVPPKGHPVHRSPAGPGRADGPLRRPTADRPISGSPMGFSNCSQNNRNFGFF